jgi:hypothetical protein
MTIATATETQQTAIRLKDLDYATTEIRVYLRDSEDNVTKVATDTSSYAEGDDATLYFDAPAPDTYDVAVKADVSGGDTRTLFQDANAFRSNPDFGS